MLRLRTLDLRDVGVFSGERSFDLSAKSTGIVGSNGRGKSTLLSLIHYCMTGDHGRLSGSDAVSLRRASEEQPYGRLVFEVDREPASVTRWLPDGNRSGKRNLVFADRSWTALDDVTNQIVKWAGVSVKVLSEFVFVEQDRLAAAARDKPADRAKALRRLFGVDEADRVRTIVGDHLSSLPSPPDPETLALLRARYVETEAAWIEARKQLEAVPPPIDGVEEARAKVVRYSSDARVQNNLSRLEGTLAECLRVQESPRIERPDPSRLNWLNLLRDDWTDYKIAVSTRDERRKRIAELAKNVEEQSKTLRHIPDSEPSPPEQLIELSSKRFSLETIVKSPMTDGACPVCAGPFSPGEDDRLAAFRDLKTLDDLTARHNRAVGAYRTLVDNERAKRESITASQYLIEKMSHEDNNFRMPNEPGVSESQIEVLIAHHNSRVAAFGADYEARSWARERAEKLQDEIVKLKMQLADPPVREEDERVARELIARNDSNESARREASARESVTREAFDSARKLLEKVEAADSEAGKVEIHRRRAIGVRDLLHSDAAPSRSVKGCLDALSTELNATLTGLRASYRISVRDDGELMAEFRDGTSTSTVRAGRISKGERAVLGLAWTIAAARRYAPEVGVLCLDEPTDGLDRERVVALRSAFQAWAEWEPDRQCIVVTHERSLMGVFERVIDLG